MDVLRAGRGMIDEYIVDSDDYVGLGSGAFSYLDGARTSTRSRCESTPTVEAGMTPAVQKRVFGRATTCATAS